MGHVEGREPPFLIMHGTADTLVSPTQSKHLHEALKGGRNKVDHVLVEGVGHGDLHWYQAPVVELVAPTVLSIDLQGQIDCIVSAFAPHELNNERLARLQVEPLA